MPTEPTATTCPKCGHVRKPADTAPAWQCPSCGIAYAKFARGGVRGPDAPRTTADEEGSFGKRLELALVGGGFGVAVGVAGWVLFALGGADFLVWLSDLWLWWNDAGDWPGWGQQSIARQSWIPHDLDILHWIIPASIGFAVLGFIKGKAGKRGPRHARPASPDEDGGTGEP